MLRKLSIRKRLTKTLVFTLIVATFLSIMPLNASAYTTVTGRGIQTPPLTFYAVSGTGSLYTSTLQTSMQTWNNAGYGTIFKYGGTKSTLANQLSNGTSVFYTLDAGKTGVYATTRYYYNTSTNYIVEADISVNTSYNYSSIIIDGVDLQSVLTHELGHALGLGHSSNTEATMYAYYENGETKKKTLHSDDLNGLAALYG